MALNGNEARTSKGKGTVFNNHCGQDLLTHQVKEKKRTVKRAAKQVPRDKATPNLSPEVLHVNDLD